MAETLTLDQYVQTKPHKKPIEHIQTFQPEIWEELLSGRTKKIPIKTMVAWLHMAKGVKISESGLFYAFKKWDADREGRVNHATNQWWTKYRASSNEEVLH